MSIKHNVNFIRNIFYFLATIRHGSIARTSQENGIKPANLSKLLKELEDSVGCPLVDRSTRGVKPTKIGQKFYDLTIKLEEELQKIEKLQRQSLQNTNSLNVFIASGLELSCIDAFIQLNPQIEVKIIKDDSIADILILNYPPQNPDVPYTKCSFGHEICQNIWISYSKDYAPALALFDFIFAKLLLECN